MSSTLVLLNLTEDVKDIVEALMLTNRLDLKMGFPMYAAEGFMASLVVILDSLDFNYPHCS